MNVILLQIQVLQLKVQILNQEIINQKAYAIVSSTPPVISPLDFAYCTLPPDLQSEIEQQIDAQDYALFGTQDNAGPLQAFDFYTGTNCIPQ